MYSKYDKTNHSVYKLTYHLVLVVKYRRKVITTPIFKSLINIFNKIKKEYPQIYKVLWNGVFWKRGYFINTTGGANIETIKQYIERQQRR